MEDIITDLSSTLTAFITAGSALLGAVVAYRIGAKWVKGFASRSS